MRDYAAVVRRQLRTSNYPAEARARLGKAVERARVAAGYPTRPAFCRARGIKNLRGLETLEQGQPGVGQKFLFEIARALPGWTEDTVELVLEGGDPPEPQADTSLLTGPEETTEGYGLPPSLQALMSEYLYFQERLSDNKDDWPRLLRLLDMYHQLQVRESAARGEADSAAHS